MKTSQKMDSAKEYLEMAKERFADLEKAISAFDGTDEAALTVRLSAGFLKNSVRAIARSMTSNA